MLIVGGTGGWVGGVLSRGGDLGYLWGQCLGLGWQEVGKWLGALPCAWMDLYLQSCWGINHVQQVLCSPSFIVDFIFFAWTVHLQPLSHQAEQSRKTEDRAQCSYSCWVSLFKGFMSILLTLFSLHFRWHCECVPRLPGALTLCNIYRRA